MCLCKLQLKGNFVATQFMCQALLVDRLEQALRKVPMDFTNTTDYATGKIVKFHPRPLRGLRALRGNFMLRLLNENHWPNEEPGQRERTTATNATVKTLWASLARLRPTAGCGPACPVE